MSYGREREGESERVRVREIEKERERKKNGSVVFFSMDEHDQDIQGWLTRRRARGPTLTDACWSIRSRIHTRWRVRTKDSFRDRERRTGQDAIGTTDTEWQFVQGGCERHKSQKVAISSSKGKNNETVESSISVSTNAVWSMISCHSFFVVTALRVNGYGEGIRGNPRRNSTTKKRDEGQQQKEDSNIVTDRSGRTWGQRVRKGGQGGAGGYGERWAAYLAGASTSPSEWLFIYLASFMSVFFACVI